MAKAKKIEVVKGYGMERTVDGRRELYSTFAPKRGWHVLFSNCRDVPVVIVRESDYRKLLRAAKGKSK